MFIVITILTFGLTHNDYLQTTVNRSCYFTKLSMFGVPKLVFI